MNDIEQLVSTLEEFAAAENSEMAEYWDRLTQLWRHNREFMEPKLLEALELEILNQANHQVANYRIVEYTKQVEATYTKVVEK
jgi:hypothetical protein